MGNDPMKLINEFFQSRPKRTLLDSIDDAFRKNSTFTASFLVDVKETSEHFKILAELPGVPKEDINVEIQGDDVIIHVKEQQHQNRRIGGVKSVSLPHYVLRKNMKAMYKHGLLEIQLDKKKPKKIEIE
ncbi:Hsp20/alpha crystallin family protein [Metabacillus halosaccharovorans]|uniref:Hsp20/alpha crystallin family protein n=1 Tax=Metabacillus halosaccharovorans TaxID=930124 RepID=A0ABT3DGU6_9BACI|nr:Hsp20/alpha crystallin family protein [Metabacillus halosaccharovorans]MCV9886285.1 Hsp20/alpha crystallin family protein [Metabacillus halosaccharovorans]